MKEQRRVFQKINKINEKTELGTHKIELSNIEMLKSITSDAKSIYNRGVKFVQKIEALTKEARVLNGDAKAMLRGGSAIISEFESKSKQLGLNPNDFQEFKKAIDAVGVMDTIEKQTGGYTKIRR